MKHRHANRLWQCNAFYVSEVPLNVHCLHVLEQMQPYSLSTFVLYVVSSVIFLLLAGIGFLAW